MSDMSDGHRCNKKGHKTRELSQQVQLTKTKNLYSQINHTLQWYREITYKNTTQHTHDK